MPNKKALIIAQPGLTTDLLEQTIAKHFTDVKVVIEKPESKQSILRRRQKKLGISKVIGQVLFMLFVHPFISERTQRIHAILRDSNLQYQPSPKAQHHIESVHNEELINIIQSFKPSLIFINGTRIIKSSVLNSTDAKFINIHVGITPAFRGVHGGFWAIKKGQPNLFGTTLHFVDSGIDTGAIIDQIILTPKGEDNFKTYPILQYCGGLKLLEKHIETLKTDSVQPTPALAKKSQLYYHPTLLEYLF